MCLCEIIDSGFFRTCCNCGMVREPLLMIENEYAEPLLMIENEYAEPINTNWDIYVANLAPQPKLCRDTMRIILEYANLTIRNENLNRKIFFSKKWFSRITARRARKLQSASSWFPVYEVVKKYNTLQLELYDYVPTILAGSFKSRFGVFAWYYKKEGCELTVRSNNFALWPWGSLPSELYVV